jgi:endogenous inhibitor of DNA gyrase (YacG/DUF329 family)
MTCPFCRQETAWEGNPWRPFCSERCQLIDLGTWAAEEYRIAGQQLLTELATEAAREPDDYTGQQQNR